jgi:soluble lytic murein transglycosylase
MRVPRNIVPQQQEIAAPVALQNPNQPNGGRALGQGIMDVANVYAKAQDDADNLRVQDAYNQLREKQLDLSLGRENGFYNAKGRDVMAPQAEGKTLSGNYMERFTTTADFIEGNLTSEAQKAKFRQRAQDSMLEFKSGLLRHENQEITAYGKSVTNASIALETDAALKQWQNPKAIAKGVANITDSLLAQGEREGIPADALKVAIQDKVSNLHSGVLAAAMEAGNLDYADKYLAENGRDMTAGDALKYKGTIDKEARTNEAVGHGNAAYAELRPQIAPNDITRLTTLVAGQESGNRERDASGKLITSPKGAQGKMQVMPATNKNPGFGVTPARDDSDAERTRVGEDYLQALLKHYGGDVNKALAAYNGGPGALDHAIKSAAKTVDANRNDPNLPVKTYLDLMPKETQDYVAAISSKYAAGAGAQSKVTIEDIHNRVRERMAGKPESQIKIAIDASTKLYDDNRKATTQRENETVAEAYRQIDANGGNYAALPSSVRSAVPGDKIDSLQNYARQRAKGAETQTDWSTYYALRSDPALLKEANLGALKGVLGDAEFKQLAGEQADLKSGKAENVTATRSANQILNSYMLQIGVDTSPKPSTSPDSAAAKMGRAMRQQQELITAAETAKGKKLTPDEIEKVTAGMFTKIGVKGSWFGPKEVSKFDVTPDTKIVVPDAERVQIIAALTAARQPASEASIMALYMRKKGL